MNLKNRTIYYNDNLQVLLKIPDNSIDLIYLDPPFAKNKTFVGSNKDILKIKKFFTDLQAKAKKDKKFEIHEGFSSIDLNTIFKDEDAAKFKDIWTENQVNSYYFEKLSVDYPCLLYTSPSPRDRQKSRMPSSA